ncbi:MAG: class I SAM-dependent methyltransferase [Ignavibacterium sp.]|nr:MAG: class I SAM-dependent methyltransferase [Ignavibacterium sp.]
MEWFKHWFNSKEYLKVYKHRDEKEAEELLELVLKNISIAENGNVLDLASGFGRHAILFAKRGFNVTAVDLSESLLSIAKDNAAAEGVNINFVHSDIRQFNPVVYYDLIVNLFTSIGYFEKDEENYFILRKVYDLLAQNGFFVLDYFNKNFVVKNLVAKTVEEIDDGTITQNRFIEGERIVKEITIDRKGKVNKFHESVRMFSSEELLNMIQKLGFNKLNVFGDFSGNPFELETSPRIIIIVNK